MGAPKVVEECDTRLEITCARRGVDKLPCATTCTQFLLRFMAERGFNVGVHTRKEFGGQIILSLAVRSRPQGIQTVQVA